MAGADDRRRCTAHRTNGDKCRGLAIRGATVCWVHGGAAKQVREKARERLESFVFPALAALRKLIDSADSDAVKLAAIRDVLDRTGYRQPEKVEVGASGRVVVEVEFIDHAVPTANGHVETTQARSRP